MRKIESYDGREKFIGCLGCAMENEEIDYSAGAILKTNHFDLHQDYEIPIPGFLIISSRRHFASIKEFTKDEEKEFINLLKKTREAMRKELNIREIAMFQNEASDHHFHIWLFPFHKWMEERNFKKKIYDLWSIIEYARSSMKTKKYVEEVNKAAAKMREHMKDFK